MPDRFLSTLKVGSVFMAVFHDVYDLQSMDFDKLRSHDWTKQYCQVKPTEISSHPIVGVLVQILFIYRIYYIPYYGDVHQQ